MADYIGTNYFIKPTYIVAMPEYINGHGGRSRGQIAAEKNLSEKDKKGILSKKSARKLSNAVNWLVSSAKEKNLYSKKYKKSYRFKINFITLTFPYDGSSKVSEKQAKRCVHAFVAYARKYFYVRNYVWKYETTKVGQLHIHITTDTFIDFRKVRKTWNRILEREGLLSGYIEKNGNANPNSTDIHAVYKVKDVAAYISKYMSKSEREMGEFKGRIWACNRELSEVNKCIVFVETGSDDKGVKYLYSPQVDFKAIMTPPDCFGESRQIAEMFFMNEEVWRKMQVSLIKETYDLHRFHIRNNIEKMPQEYWSGFIDDLFSNNLKTKKNEKTIPQNQPPNGTIHRGLQKGRQERHVDNQVKMAYTVEAY